MKTSLLFLSLLLFMQSCFIFKKKECRGVDQSNLSKYAQEQIEKGVLKGDTMICKFHLTWTANKTGDSNITIE